MLLLVVSIQRYRKSGFTISSLSSQFLESRQLFWGSVPFHLAILFLFFGHLIGFMFPRSVALWNGTPIRLVILEVSGLTAGLLALIGLCILIARRYRNARLRVVSTPMDGSSAAKPWSCMATVMRSSLA